ncbi:MAG: hypothetical protein K0R14_1509 [Burkholderiales bacterium]|jgi:hypothetical protein|nr:hypothetical protein [Burkholderiales bacterium]
MLSKSKILFIVGMSFISLANAHDLIAEHIDLNQNEQAGTAYISLYVNYFSGDEPSERYKGTIIFYTNECKKGGTYYYEDNLDLPAGCVIKGIGYEKKFKCDNKSCTEKMQKESNETKK